jgi:hypothetical protein
LTFRLSAQEYELVYAASRAEGARSMSEFARSAVLERTAAQADTEAGNVAHEFADRDARLEDIVKTLQMRIEVVKSLQAQFKKAADRLKRDPGNRVGGQLD